MLSYEHSLEVGDLAEKSIKRRHARLSSCKSLKLTLDDAEKRRPTGTRAFEGGRKRMKGKMVMVVSKRGKTATEDVASRQASENAKLIPRLLQ